MSKGKTIQDYRDRQVYIDKAHEVEAKNNIPRNLLVGLLNAESSFDKNIISGKRKSSAGAIGIAQFMPGTAKEYGIDPTNPIASIEAAGKYLNKSYNRFGNWDDAVRSYNMGPGGVSKWKQGKRGLPKETKDYLTKVNKYANIKPKPVKPTSYFPTPLADAAIEQANNWFTSIPTTDVKDLDNEEVIDTFEDVENEEEEDEDIKAVKQQTKEHNFLQEYQGILNTNAVVQQEIEEPAQQIPVADLEGIFNQVSNFVDTPVAQEGVNVKANQEWLQNWYQNRQLPDPELNAIYQAEKPLYVERSKNLPEPNYVESIDNLGTQGLYTNAINKLDLIKGADSAVHTHEATHAINVPLQDTESSMQAFMHARENVLPKEQVQNQWAKENYNELSNYQEVIGRLNPYRQIHSLQPNQEITPELIKANRESYQNNPSQFENNTDQLYKIFDDQGLSNVLNKVVTNTTPTGNYAQQGVIVDNQGQYNHPGEVTQINSPNITMQNVPYPVLGISKETGEQKMMLPGQDYFFENTDAVVEYPQLSENEKKFLKYISKLK